MLEKAIGQSAAILDSQFIALVLVKDRANSTSKCTMGGPPRQNSCRLDRIDNSGVIMRERDGTIRAGIQGQSGGAVAAAGERGVKRT